MIDIQVKGLDKATKKLDRLMKATSDLRPAFADLGKVIVQEFKANFPAAGKVLNAPWPKRKKEYPWPILQKTGKLRGNWNQKASKQELRISNPTHYAPYHHFGTPKLPIRKLVGHTEKIMKLARERIEKYLRTIIR